jgi:hypothetical protein
VQLWVFEVPCEIAAQTYALQETCGNSKEQLAWHFESRLTTVVLCGLVNMVLCPLSYLEWDQAESADAGSRLAGMLRVCVPAKTVDSDHHLADALRM